MTDKTLRSGPRVIAVRRIVLLVLWTVGCCATAWFVLWVLRTDAWMRWVPSRMLADLAIIPVTIETPHGRPWQLNSADNERFERAEAIALELRDRYLRGVLSQEDAHYAIDRSLEVGHHITRPDADSGWEWQIYPLLKNPGAALAGGKWIEVSDCKFFIDGKQLKEAEFGSSRGFEGVSLQEMELALRLPELPVGWHDLRATFRVCLNVPQGGHVWEEEVSQRVYISEPGASDPSEDKGPS